MGHRLAENHPRHITRFSHVCNYDHIHDDGDDDDHLLITACRRGIVLVILTIYKNIGPI